MRSGTLKYLLLSAGLLLGLALAWQGKQSAKENERLDAALSAASDTQARLLRTLASLAKSDGEAEARVSAEERRHADLVKAEEAWGQKVQAALDQLKEDRRVHPWPGRQPELPRGPFSLRYGLRVFPELLGEAGYNRLIRQRVRLDEADSAYWGTLSLAPELREKAIELLVDAKMLELEYVGVQLEAGIEKPVDRSSALRKEETKLRDELRALVGAEALAVIEKVPDREMIDSWRIETIEKRLSYSAEPLQAGQIKQLSALMAAQEAEARLQKKPLYTAYSKPREGFDPARMKYNDALLTQASAFLTAQQLQGLRELQAELRASIERNLLPK